MVFRVFINLFYLAMCLSQLVPILRVESPIVHLFPLTLVTVVFMLKEGIEDYKRHARDKEHNTQKFSVVTGEECVFVSSERLKLGQVITLKQGERVPADLLLLRTSEPNGASFVRTDQLDGETDWKLKRAVATTQALPKVTDILNIYSVTTIEEPKDDFYNFTGKITFYYNPNNVNKTVDSEQNTRGDSGNEESFETIKTSNTVNSGKESGKDTVEGNSFDTLKSYNTVNSLNKINQSDVVQSSVDSGVKNDTDESVGDSVKDSVTESLNVDNVIWMNSIVASGTIHGLIIYIGKDARACLNSKRSKMKFGLFESELNRLFVVLVFIMLVMCVLMLAPTGFGSKWYITFLKYLLLFSTIVPLSLRINLDIAKYVYNRGIVLDKKIPQTMPRTTMIPEELGRVNYLLTDKTGTLTQNVISLEKLYVTRGYYTNEDVDVIIQKINSVNQSHPASTGNTVNVVKDSVKDVASSSVSDGFDNAVVINNKRLPDSLEGRLYLSLLSLAICHNVRPISGKDESDFQGSSPDEIALVRFASTCSVRLCDRDDSRLRLEVCGSECEFRILLMLPFSSETKRMGLIVEDGAGRKHLFLKGAEVVVIPMLLPRGSVWLSEECDNLARMGLRTLVFAYRALDEAEFQSFAARYAEASLSLEDRTRRIRRVTASLEHDMLLVGLTGVRDRLQRGVGSTLESLRSAGIKVWMLTGDKIDTARCVAISCGLIHRNSIVQQLSIDTLSQNTNGTQTGVNIGSTGMPDVSEMIKYINTFSVEDGESLDLYNTYMEVVVGLIMGELNKFLMGPISDTMLIFDSFITGICINSGLSNDPQLRTLFIKCIMLCNNIIFCRCTPQMKAEVVKLLRAEKKIVCCIGDGDNDVPMITEANVGIGIVGREGLQASLSSDYSLIEFSHIKRLLLWHGRNSYKRSSTMANFLIHRGVIISIMQAIFSSIYYFMPIAFFQGWLLVGFTSYYNMIPIFCLVLDVEIKEEDVMLFPELYIELKKGREFNIKVFMIWIWISIFQGAVLMIGAIILFENSLVSLISIGCTSLFLLEIFNLISELHTWHRLTIIGLVCTCIVYFYSLLVFRNNFDMEFIARKSFFWKVLFISIVAWLPIYIIKFLVKLLKPPQYIKLYVS